ncbi:hypothetical protein ES703_10576 [subsurface metagenome]
MKPPWGSKNTNPNKANFKRGTYATLRSSNATQHELIDRAKRIYYYGIW